MVRRRPRGAPAHDDWDAFGHLRLAAGPSSSPLIIKGKNKTNGPQRKTNEPQETVAPPFFPLAVSLSHQRGEAPLPAAPDATTPKPSSDGPSPATVRHPPRKCWMLLYAIGDGVLRSMDFLVRFVSPILRRSRFTMTRVSTGLLKGLRRVLEQRVSTVFCRQSRVWSSTVSFSDIDEKGDMEYNDNFPDSKRELRPQSVDPKKGWEFRGVHRAIICGKVGQVPVQKILRNGHTVTVFTVGTGGMFDQRVIGPNDLPKPAQWHRIAVHNDILGAYAVQKLVKNSAVYVEGDIETRVYNDSVNDQVKNIPEICVRRDGKIRLIKSGDSAANISLDELRGGLF